MAVSATSHLPPGPHGVSGSTKVNVATLRDHILQFYEDDNVLCDKVASFLAEGLIAAQRVVVIAIEAHRHGVATRLVEKGLNVEGLEASGQLTLVDAREALSKFMTGGMPNEQLFRRHIGGLIEQNLQSPNHSGVRVYGELVDVLWRDGNPEGATRVEDLWNALASTHPFSLLCAYAMGHFYKEGHASQLRELCYRHTHVTAADTNTAGENEQSLHQLIRQLQQRSLALETEIRHRQELEQMLRDALTARRRSEEELRVFLEHAPEGLHWIGPDGIILWANQAELDVLGYSREEYVGHHIAEFHADQESIDEILAQLSRNGVMREREARLRCKDGSIRYVLINTNALWEDGQFIHARCFTRDITERKRAEETRAWLASIVESSDDAIVSKTLDGIITSWNGGAERIFGYTAAEAIGQHISLIIPLERRAEEDAVLARLRRGKKVGHFQTVRCAKDGRSIDVSLTISPITSADGRILGASKVARGITAQKRADLAVHQSEQRYRRIFETASVSIWEQDFTEVKAALEALRDKGLDDFEAYFAEHPEFVDACIRRVKVVDVNNATLRMFGAHDKDALCRSLPNIFEPETRDVFVGELIAIAKGKPTFETEAIVKTVDGDRVHTLVNITFPAPSESFESVLVTLTDITARKAAEEALREEVRVRQTLAQVGSSLAAELNTSRVVQAVTDACTTVTTAQFGAFFYNVDDDSGEAYQLYTLSGAPKEAFEQFPKPRVIALFGPTFRGEGVIRLDDVSRDPRYGQNAPHEGMPQGHVPVRSYLAVPVVSKSGAVLGGLFLGHSQPGIFTTEHEQLAVGIASWAAIALDNAHLYHEVEKASLMKDEFLATLSHELRTPLNAILGWSQMLRSGRLRPDMQQRALDSLERNAKAQAQLVEDLLDLSRIVSGKLKIEACPVNLAGVVSAAVDTIGPTAALKRVNLHIDTEAGRELVVTGDAARLQQVVWNLLSNAVKFTPAQGRVDVQLQESESKAEIIVTDTGRGIAPSALPCVFERFRQADGATARAHGGLGLGLAIVQYITEAHGGTVNVESDGEGRGTTLRVRLPVRAVTAATRRRATSATDSTPAIRTAARALVVDDEPDARELIGAVLESYGAYVTTVGSAGEALHILGRQAFDVLLADIGMPEQDGYSLIRAIRSLPTEQGGQIPAVAVTAYASTRERERALEAGYDSHLAKPVEPDHLIAVVVAATSNRPAMGQAGLSNPEVVERD
ncbi:MAG: PAS domain S-box protein [Luteitalea sp.]|nr:PAS domain S-box protein [Luteitalea sp.]